MKGWVIPQGQSGVVNEVEVPGDFFECVSRYTGGNELVVELVISRPIVADLRQSIDPHNDHKTEVCSDFCEVGLPCGGTVCSSETLCCKQVGLSDNERQDFLIEKMFQHLQWVPTCGQFGPHWVSTGVNMDLGRGHGPSC